MNCPLMEQEIQPSKNRPNIFSNSISRFFCFCKRNFQEKGCVAKTNFRSFNY